LPVHGKTVNVRRITFLILGPQKSPKLRPVNAKISGFFVGSLFLVLLGSSVRAADQQALVQQVTTLDDAATASYSAGDFDKMKKQLLKALGLGKEALSTDPIMARVYLHLGVLYVDGLDNRAVGVKYFTKALKIRPDIEVRSNMGTKTVMAAFAEAGQQAAAAEDEGQKEAAKPAKASKKEAAAEAEEEAPPARPTRAAAASSERCRSDADIAAVKKEAREEFDRLEKALTMSKDALTKEQKESEKYRKGNMDLERQLGEAKQRVTQLENESGQKDKRSAAGEQREKKERDAKQALEKEKTEKDSLLLDTAQRVAQLEKESADKDKQIAAGTQREKKERDAKEKLEREKMERDQTIADLKRQSQRTEADLKQRLQAVEKDKADKEKQLAATTDRERKEREAKEKLERDRQTADARDRERKGWEERARAERDKVEALPPLPSHIPEPLHCAVPEEIQGGADLFVSCVTQPKVQAKTIVFYYRPPSSTVYNAVVMDPTKRGWSRAVITANKLNGKLLQYYAEARDGRDSVSATNGKASSPNIVTIAPAARGH
jgi:hypothetical protein